MNSLKNCTNTFSVITLGCRVNQYESDAVIRQMTSAGWTQAPEGEPADVCIINTCTVTQKASMQSRQAVRQAVRRNPNARILVTGCYAETEPDEIRKIQGVHEVVVKEKLELGIGNYELGIMNETIPNSKFPIPNSSRTRPYVKIQDGCDAFCTYCIVPYARGRSRSVPVESVLNEIRQIRDACFHEIVLTGIHLGCYGRDLSPQTGLLALLMQIHDADLIERVRLSSIEPHEIGDDLIRFAAESGRICHHFHIPLQSGDDGILKRMGRPYSGDFFRNLIYRIREMLPDAAIGADTLIGFPGETDQAFENTFSMIEELPISYLHVFPFSPRKGTPAFSFPDKVPSSVITERSQRIRELGRQKRRMFYHQFVGKTLRVLIENTRDNASGLLKGISSNYLPVMLDGPDALKNTFADVLTERLTDSNQLFGAVLDDSGKTAAKNPE